MDPITIAVVAALPALASGAIKDAYEGLKAVIRRKWGDAAPLTKAVTALEQDPASKAQAAVLAEKVDAIKAHEDPDVLLAVRELIEQLSTENRIPPQVAANIQITMSGGSVQGNMGVGTANIETMTFNAPTKAD
jgi:hypothetical protein